MLVACILAPEASAFIGIVLMVGLAFYALTLPVKEDDGDFR